MILNTLLMNGKTKVMLMVFMAKKFSIDYQCFMLQFKCVVKQGTIVGINERLPPTLPFKLT